MSAGTCCSDSVCSSTVAPSSGVRLSLRIRGLDCAEEVATLKRALAPLVAEDALSFDVLNGRMNVHSEVSLADVQARVRPPG